MHLSIGSFGLPDGNGIKVSSLAGKSSLSKETSNSNQHDGGNIMGSAPLSRVGSNFKSIFGVQLKSLGDIDDLTKGIETGKYEAVLNGMTIEKHKVVMDAIFAMWDMILVANPNISSKENSYANIASGASMVINKHDATSIKPPIKLTKPVVILDVSIASKEELIGLAAHALVLELARGFDYVNSDSDTDEVFSTCMTFGENTRDLGSFREETDKITDLHQIHEEVLFTESGDGVAGIKQRRRDLSSDGVKDLATAPGRGRLKEDLESST
ncbi:hypothetical protein Tco_0991928 [Tanacetum coccineum]|uniref:Uncharacterized protein n=1 Tax=Tanacetum coccineum TaxID=301880 RepID=A0ABQ5F1F7_9ASTR